MKTAVCAIAKKENNYIREWVEHYKRLGFDTIFLYDNNDLDGEHFEDVIGDYIGSGYVRVLNLRGRSTGNLQRYAYTSCYSENGRDYDWILFVDIDEFLHLEDGYTLESWLSNPVYDTYDAIGMFWKLYTDSGLVKVEDNNYSVTRFNKWVPSRQGKSIIRGGKEIRKIRAHGTSQVNRCNVDGDPSYIVGKSEKV